MLDVKFSSFDYIQQIYQRDPLEYLRSTVSSERYNYLISHPPEPQAQKPPKSIVEEANQYKLTQDLPAFLKAVYGTESILCQT